MVTKQLSASFATSAEAGDILSRWLGSRLGLDLGLGLGSGAGLVLANVPVPLDIPPSPLGSLRSDGSIDYATSNGGSAASMEAAAAPWVEDIS